MPGAVAAQPALTTLRIATTPLDASALVYYAQQDGAFARAGLNVELQVGQQESMAPAVASNSADIGYASLPALALGHVKGIPFVLIAPASVITVRAPTGALLVLPDSPIHSARDLSGKTIALPGLASLADYATRAWIDRNGGDSTTVKFLEIPVNAMPNALASGRVDAINVAEPYIALAKKTGRVLAYPNGAVAKEFIGAGFFTTTQWAAAHPDLVRRFAAVMLATAKAANQNPASTVAMLAAYTKLPIDLIANTTRARYAETFSPALMQPFIDVSAKYGDFPTFPARELLYQPHAALPQ